MRKNFFVGLLVTLSMTLMSSTCSSDDDNSSNSNVNVQELTNISTSGTWRISSYLDDGQDETYHFSNFNFTFMPDGSLTAVSEGTSITGMWSIADDDSNDDDSSSDEDFNLFFNVSADSEFEDLNDDWDIMDYDDNTISLKDVSGGDGSVDTLVFTKN